MGNCKGKSFSLGRCPLGRAVCLSECSAPRHRLWVTTSDEARGSTTGPGAAAVSEEPTFGQGSLKEAEVRCRQSPAKLWVLSLNIFFFCDWEELLIEGMQIKQSGLLGWTLRQCCLDYSGGTTGNFTPCKLLQTAPVRKVTSLPLYLLYLIFIF